LQAGSGVSRQKGCPSDAKKSLVKGPCPTSECQHYDTKIESNDSNRWGNQSYKQVNHLM
jgi:hypothetical protein